jgi:signal peptidase I
MLAGDRAWITEAIEIPSAGMEPTPRYRRPRAGRHAHPARASARSACAPHAHYVVPPGQVFALGDNRDNSADSRLWGPVPVDHVIRRAHGIWWSHRPMTGIRLDRLGPL